MKIILLLIGFLFSVNCYALKPDRNYSTTPDSLGMKYSQQTIKTADGCNLNTWIFRPETARDNKVTLILSYGDMGNMSYWLQEIKALSESGFTVVAFDYRGFGKSDDFHINPEKLYYDEFGTDLRAVINWTKKNLKQNKTGIYAFSMGTIVTTLALQNEEVDFLIGEGYVYDTVAYVAKIKALKGRDTLLPKEAEKYVSLLGKIKCKMLLIAGEHDQFTSVEDSKKIIRLGKNRRLIKFNGGHGEGFMKMTKANFGDEYVNELARFSVSL